MITSRPPTDAWARFRHHARRVRELHLCNLLWRDNPLHCDTYRALREYYPGAHLLPNLRAFSCADAHPEAPGQTILPMFMPPTLREASIDLRFLDESTTSYFLKGLAGCSLLRKLRFDPGHRIDREKETQLSVAICALPGLEELDLGSIPLSLQALDHVVALPTLRKLTMGIENPVSNALFSASAKPRRILSSLSTLSISFPASQKESIFPLLRAMLKTQLSELRITIGVHGDTEADWDLPAPLRDDRKYLESVAEGLAKITSLNTLALGAEKALWSADNLTFTDASLAPLLSKKTMRSFSLSSLPAALSRDALQQIASSWPNIHTLDLTCPGGSRLDIKDLLPLTRCSHLTLLGVLIDGTVDAVSLESRLLPGQSTSKLQTLQLGESELPNPAHLAAFLYGAFPSAEIGPEYKPLNEGSWWFEDGDKVARAQVNSYLDAFRKARKLEDSSAMDSLKPEHGLQMRCPGSECTVKDIVAGRRLGQPDDA